MKVFLFSHIADCDGLMPVILSKLAFSSVDYKLLDTPIDDEFLKYVDNIDFSIYDYIFMTDLCIKEDTIKKLDGEFLKKFKIFDHHIGNVNMNKYDFISVIDEIDNNKQSGTSLFYDYLCKNFDNNLLRKKVTKKLVDIIRLSDTWSWEEGQKVDTTLTDFLSIFGLDEFISYFYNFILNNDDLYIEEKYKFLFEVEEKRKFKYILEKDKELIRANINSYRVGIVFAELYRSLLGNSLAKKYNDLDFIIIINVSRSISYRAVKDGVDLSLFAQIYGGNGHKLAAGSPIPNNLKNEIIKFIYKEVKIDEE